MTRQEAFQFIRTYCKLHGIRLRTKTRKNVYGTVCLNTDTVFIQREGAVVQILSTFFHEVNHIRCKYDGIFPIYHLPERRNAAEMKKIRQQAYRAEVKVDKMARDEMRTYFPMMKYRANYLTGSKKQNKKWLMEYYK